MKYLDGKKATICRQFRKCINTQCSIHADYEEWSTALYVRGEPPEYTLIDRHYGCNFIGELK